MTNITTALPAVGDRVAIRDQYKGQPTTFCFEGTYGIEVGDTATVVEVFKEGATSDADYSLRVEWDKDTRDNGTNWGSGWFDVIEPAEAPQRPLVHFDDDKAGRDRSKARAACAEAVSRVLDPEHNTRLRNAAAGESVDAYDLNAAITAAIRSAATRNGQSTARREQAKRFAHVAHIVQAVLENHADTLPGYEPGVRSRVLAEVRPALAEAKREIDHAGEVNQRLTQDLTAAREERAALTQAASDERRRLVEEANNLRGNLAQTIREANEFEATLAYAKAMLTDEQAAQIEAFADGFRVGSED